METEKIANKLINGIKKAQVDLEELQLQLALGKAEAKDKYEEAKKEFNRLVHQTRLKVKELKGKKSEVQERLEELQVQLALGRAETLDAFIAQKKRIVKALSALENALKANKLTAELQSKLQHEIGKFRIKLEIIRLNFELGRMEIKEEFEEKKADLMQRLQEMKSKISASKAGNSQHFGAEIKEAYRHLQKAFA